MGTAQRVLVVYTGGTIGMVETPDGLAPGADLADWLDDLVASQLPGLAVDLVELDPLLDSSSVGPRQWQQIADLLASHDHELALVLHGTDTLAYTAAALSWAVAGSGQMVVLTGSQRPLGAADSDAAGNVVGALQALLAGGGGVSVVFDGIRVAGHRASKCSSVADQGFTSVNAPCLGLGEAPNGPVWTGNQKQFGEVDLVVVSLHPGLSAGRLAAMLTPAPQAVVLRAFGAGNAPDDPGLVQVLADAHAAGTVLVVTSQCPDGGVRLGHYASGGGLLRAGALSGGDLGVEALVAALTFLLSQGLSPDQVRDRLREHVEAARTGR